MRLGNDTFESFPPSHAGGSQRVAADYFQARTQSICVVAGSGVTPAT